LIITLPQIAIFGVAGFILHRADVGGIAHIPITGQPYLPALTEIVISLGLVAGMTLIFLFFVERFPVWEEPPPIPDHFTPPIPDPVSRSYFGGYWFSRAHLAATTWIVGAVIGVALLELTTADADPTRNTPVRSARAVAALRVASDGQPSSRLVLLGVSEVAAELPAGLATGLLIDGDRRGVAVLFDHQRHQDRLGDQASCGRCHHRNLRLDRGTPCSVCHADMYRCTDIFDHEHHVAMLDGNASCARCHGRPDAPKTRRHATACRECHAADIIDCFTEERHPCVAHTYEGDHECGGCHHSMTEGISGAPSDHRSRCGIAPGYRLAMHRLCIECHCVHQADIGVEDPHMTRCGCCHLNAESDLDIRPQTPQMTRIAAMQERFE